MWGEPGGAEMNPSMRQNTIHATEQQITPHVNLLETKILKPIPELMNQNLSFNSMPRCPMHTEIREALP